MCFLLMTMVDHGGGLLFFSFFLSIVTLFRHDDPYLTLIGGLVLLGTIVDALADDEVNEHPLLVCEGHPFY